MQQTRDSDEICRVCLYEGPNLTNIFQVPLVDSEQHNHKANDFVEDPNIRFCDVLRMLTPTKVLLNDGLPPGICSSCVSRVLDAYILRQQIERSNRSLIEIRKSEQSSNKLEIVEDVMIVFKKGNEQDVEVYNVKTIKGTSARKSKNCKDEPIDEAMEQDEEEEEEEVDEYVEMIDGANDDEDGVSFLLSSLVTPTETPSNTSSPDAKPKRKIANRKHECSVCKRTFSRKSNLVDHLRLHANMRPFKCDVCDATFVQTGNLKAHMRVHTKERPFECSICGKTYNQSGALKVHIRVHTNERNFKCETCGKAFTNASDRNKHARVHDENAQFQCTSCPRSFAQRVNLKLHMTKYHGGNIDPPKTKKAPKTEPK